MVYILLGTGFEEMEALTPCDLLRRAGVELSLVGIDGIEITGSHGISVRADLTLEEVSTVNLEMLVLPGGLRGVESILNSPAALKLIRLAWEAGKFVCAICAAPTILAKLGILQDTPATCYPGKEREMGDAKLVSRPVVRSGKLITGRAAGSGVEFSLALIEALKGEAEARRIAKQIVYDC